MDENHTELIELDADPLPAQRNARGHFARGNRLGEGRPSTRQTELVAQAIEPHRQALIDRALTIAKADTDTAAVQAIKLLLERLSPAPKVADERVHIPGLANELTWEGRALAVLHAVASGDVSAAAGKQLLGMIGDFTRALAADRYEAKFAELERLIKGGGTVVDVQAAPAAASPVPAAAASHDLL